MLPVRRDVSIGSWAVGGIPIVATLLQAILAAIGVSALSLPGVAAITRVLHALAVFDSAARIFRGSSGVVFALFALVALAWIAQGVAMLVFERQQWTYAAAGFVTLFFALFFLVYLPIFSADIPAVQLVVFVLIPVLASGANWLAALTYPWAPDLADQTETELSAARSAAQDARRTFETIYERELDDPTRERLRAVAPGAVEQARTTADEFRDECQQLLDAIDALSRRERGLSSDERLQEAKRLRGEAEKLDAQAQFSGVRDRLVDALVDACYESFDDLHVVSRYRESYEIRNLGDYRSLSLPSIGVQNAQLDTAHDSVPDRIAEAARQDAELADLARAVESVQTHIEELQSRIDREEREFAESVDDAEATVETLREKVADVDGMVGTRLEQLLVEGRYESDSPPGPAVPDVEDALQDGKTALHECDFRRAKQHATEAENLATELVSVVEFFEGVSTTIQQRGDSIPYVDSVSPAFASLLRVPYEETYDVEYSVTDDAVEFSYPTTSDEKSASAPSVSATASQSNSTSSAGRSTDGDAETADEVLYLLRELKSQADTSTATDDIQYQTEGLPEYVLADPVLDRLSEFVGGQPAIESIEIESELDPGYISVEIAPDQSPKTVMDAILDRFQETVGR
jgi:hypothetical protein